MENEKLKEFLEKIKEQRAAKVNVENATQPPAEEEFTEIPEMRQDNIKHYRGSNGKMKMVIGGNANDPVSLRDSGEQYTALVPEFTAKFNKHTHGKLMEMEKEGYKISLEIPACNCGNDCVCHKTEKDSELVYENVLPGTDISYETSAGRVKENIIVKERKEVYDYAFILRAEGLVAELAGKTVHIKNTEGKEIFRIPAPYMIDSAGAVSNDVSYELVPAGSGAYLLKICADAAWINAGERAFPVRIDPTVTISNGNSYASLRGFRVGIDETYWDDDSLNQFIGVNYTFLHFTVGTVNINALCNAYGIPRIALTRLDIKLTGSANCQYDIFTNNFKEQVCTLTSTNNIYTVPYKDILDMGYSDFAMTTIDGSFVMFQEGISIELEYKAISLSSISVTTAPTKTAYIEGEIFNKTGMAVKATYTDSTTSTLASSEYTVTPSGALTLGTTSVTVSYTTGGVTKTTTQAITVAAKALTGIAIITPPTKMMYIVGESFDKTGMVVEATYNNGEKTTLASSKYTVTPSGALTSGTTFLTISYTAGGVTKTATQAITVAAKALTRIDIIKAPTQTSYVEGDTFNKAGMVVKATYNNGAETLLASSEYTVTPSGALTAGATSVTISYVTGGVTKTTTQTIKVVEITSITVTTSPIKKYYFSGEFFDPMGMVVTANCIDNTSQVVMGYTYNPTGALSASSNVVISYGGKTASPEIIITDVDANKGYYGNKNLSFSDFGENPKLNLSTRRMLYVQPDTSIGANSFAVSVSHVYDSQMKQLLSKKVIGLPAGWKLDAHQFLIADGTEDNKTTYKYIDGAGYVHTFLQLDNDTNRYYDIDGMGLILDRSNTTNPIIKDSQGNKMVFENERLIEKISCENDNMKKVFKYDTAGKLKMIYDSRKLLANEFASISLVFNYTDGLLTSICARNSTSSDLTVGIKHKLVYGYENGNLTTVTKVAENGTNKVICRYAYDSYNKLTLITDAVRNTAVKVLHGFNIINQDYTAFGISNGIINSDQAFVEKTFYKVAQYYVQSTDYKTYREVHLLNEKWMRTSVQLNGKGRIISTFECDASGNLKTLTKDTGIELSKDGTSGNKTINGRLPIAFTNGSLTLIDRVSPPGLSLIRTGDNGYRFYQCQFWLNHSSTAKRLRAQLRYSLNDRVTSITKEVEIDASAYESWQQVSIPIDIENASYTIRKLTLTLLASNEAKVTANACNFRFIPSGNSTMYLGLNDPIDFEILNNSGRYNIKSIDSATGVENNSGWYSPGNPSIYFTQNDISQTLPLILKPYLVQGKTCYDVVCNNGSKKIGNVNAIEFTDSGYTEPKTVSLSYDSFNSFYNMSILKVMEFFNLRKTKDELMPIGFMSKLFSEPYLSNVENSKIANCFISTIAPNNKSITRQFIIGDADKIGTINMVSVSTDKEKDLDSVSHVYVKHSIAAAFADYKGKKIIEIDAYGIKTGYEYHTDGSQKKAILTGTDGKQIILAESVMDTTNVNAQYVNSVRSGHGGADFTYKQPYNLTDTETVNDYNFEGNSYYPTSGNVNNRYTYDIFNETVEKVEAFVGTSSKGYNEIIYENGRIKTVYDGKSKYGIKYRNNEMDFTVFKGEIEYTIQNHRTYVDSGTTTKVDTFYRLTGPDDIITTKIDKYGHLTSTKDIYSNETKYNYQNTGNESNAADTLSSIEDPYEAKIYSYQYDHDWKPIGWSTSDFAVRQLSSTDTKYTFGSNEKYLTSIIYDPNTTIEPRIEGVRNYYDPDSNDNFVESETEYGAIMSWKYLYDKCGRMHQKINKYDDAANAKYTYEYMTSGNRTLPVVTKCIYEGSVLGDWNYAKYNFDYEYTERGMPKKITEQLTSSKAWVTTHTDVKEYTYDEFDRLLTATITENGAKTTYKYEYNTDGRMSKLMIGGTSRYFEYNEFGYRYLSLFYANRFMNSYYYAYDNYGNRIRKSGVSERTLSEYGQIYTYNWMRGSCLDSVNDSSNSRVATYFYDRNGARFKKIVKGVTINYYHDGNKILGEDRSNGIKLRYFYDADGVCGFRYYNGNGWAPYTYVKDPMGNIVMIKNEHGAAMAKYTYDSFGKFAVHKITPDPYVQDPLELEIGNVNPFRWKGHYYDADMETNYESGYYYIDGRYYDPTEGLYIDAEPIENMFANAETVFGLDRHSPTYNNILMLAAYAYTIFALSKFYPDPDSELGITYKLTGATSIWSWLLSGIMILAGFIMLFTPLWGFGLGLMFGGALGILGTLFSSQFASGLGMAATGLQSIITGIMLMIGACNPVVALLGFVGFIAGITTTAFASAEIQEGLGNGNWIKDAGMSEGLYNGVMWTSYGISIFVNIVGPVANKYGAKCFIAGTLVLTAEGYKKIEDVEVGDMVLAYDEGTGEQGYKEVVQLFRNKASTKTQLTIKAEDGTVDEITSTPGHKYYLPNNKRNRNANEQLEHASYGGLNEKWVSACDLKKGDRVLLANADSLTGKPKYGIVIGVKTEECEEFTTYNFEVADFHTYYVGENGVCVHNAACNVDGVIEETLANQGQGNITSKYRLTPDEALDAGQKFLGKGYSEGGDGVFYKIVGNKRYQFRMDPTSLAGTHNPYVSHVHLEIFAAGQKQAIVNNHIILNLLGG